MISNINSICIYKNYCKSALLNIKFLNMNLYYLSLSKKYISIVYFTFTVINYVHMLKLVLNIVNLFLANINIKKLYINSISTAFLPKKYSLTTVLKSPHIDKRSREQFHLVEYKSLVTYPLIFSVSKDNLFNKLFLFEQNFNMVSNITKFR